MVTSQGNITDVLHMRTIVRMRKLRMCMSVTC